MGFVSSERNRADRAISLSRLRWASPVQFNIYVRTLIAVSAVLVIVTLLATIWSVQQQQRDFTDQLMTRLDELASWQAVAVSSALWDLNRDGVRANLRGLAQDREFVSAVVKDEKGRIFAQLQSGDADAYPVVSTEKEIVLDEQGKRKNIGTLTLTLSHKWLFEAQKRSLIELFTLALVQLAAVLIVVTLVLRALIRPLTAISNRTVAVAQGNLESAVPYQERTDPVGDVARAVEAFRNTALQRSEEQRALRQAHEQLHKANADLAAAGRAKDEFLASISHELRTPLSTIMWITELLQNNKGGGTTDDKQQQYVQMIYDNSEHLLALINDILDIARAEAGELQLEIGTVNIKTVCSASVQLIKPEADKKQQQLVLDIDSELSIVRADQRRLKQILVNLLNNAVKFTPCGGQIGLQVTSEREQGIVQFAVWDTGIGIAEDAMTQLFKPFVQIDSRLSREYEGSGLGLSLVHHLVEMHGGGIKARSTVGKGSCFTVSLAQADLPAATGDAAGNSRLTGAKALPGPLQQYETVQQAPLILLVDDSENTLELLSEQLRSEHYRVAVARDGTEAIAKARKVSPDLILMDIQMPGMDGLEATLRLRRDRRFANTPIIALTALAMPGDRDRCLAAGADEYLSKPIPLKRLLAAVEARLKQ